MSKETRVIVWTVIIGLVLFAFANWALADMSLDNSDYYDEATADPGALSFTCGADTDALVIGITTQLGSPREAGAPTYNGATFTQAGTVETGGQEGDVEVWYLLAPSTGSAYSISVPNSGSARIEFSAASMIAAGSSVAVFDTVTQNGGASGGSTISLDITPGAIGNFMFNVLHSGYSAAAISWSDILIASQDLGQENFFSQYAVATTTDTHSFTVTYGSGDDYGIMAASFEEYTAPEGERQRMISH